MIEPPHHEANLERDGPRNRRLHYDFHVLKARHSPRLAAGGPLEGGVGEPPHHGQGGHVGGLVGQVFVEVFKVDAEAGVNSRVLVYYQSGGSGECCGVCRMVGKDEGGLGLGVQIGAPQQEFR